MPKDLSPEDKNYIWEAYYVRGLAVKDIAIQRKLARSTVYKYIQSRKEGSMEIMESKTRRPPRIRKEEYEQLKQMVQDHPGRTIVEYCGLWHKLYGDTITKSSLHRAFQRAGITSGDRKIKSANKNDNSSHLSE